MRRDGAEIGETANRAASSTAFAVEEDVTFWRDVVGIDVKAAQDVSLFRVLEWGGMEVIPH